jgi:methionyl-tRNA formyltransferase
MATPQAPLKTAFMGTPSFAATVLEHLAAWPGAAICGVWCRPDRPAGRGRRLSAPAVKLSALAHGFDVHQPESFATPETLDALAACVPDVLVVVAYGMVLPQRVLDIPRLAPVNVHASLLPRYRGAAPVQRAIMDGCAQTGVSVMRMEAALDSGPVYAARAVDIGEHTAGTLHDVLAGVGGELLLNVLEEFRRIGGVEAAPQNEADATYAPKLGRAEEWIETDAPVHVVHARIRALTPRPGARVMCVLPPRSGEGPAREVPVLLAPGRPGAARPDDMPAGSLWLGENGELSMACGDALYTLSSLCPAGRAFMSAPDFVRGFLPSRARGLCGEVLSRGRTAARL